MLRWLHVGGELDSALAALRLELRGAILVAREAVLDIDVLNGNAGVDVGVVDSLLLLRLALQPTTGRHRTTSAGPVELCTHAGLQLVRVEHLLLLVLLLVG